MPLAVALLFHFNQHFSEYARVASRACYLGLLRVLRSHAGLRFNIHISGTLIDALKWVDPEPLELIRDGLEAGQFELLGSTYAQNVAYASDDWDNARQIELHRETIRDAFGVEPAGFWNPERCWRQSLVPLIAGAGYRYTLIEDHILRRAGATEPFVFTTGGDAGAPGLTIVTDDESFKHKFNLAAWFGRDAQALSHLRGVAARPESGRMCVAYAEDAEAMGLWGWEHDVVPNHTWAHLDEFLAALAAEDDLRLIHLSGAPEPAADLTPIADGSAAWMDASLKRPEAPYHEDGYANWFDFYQRSPKLAHFRQTYGIIRAKIQAIPVEQQPEAVLELRRAALHAFCAHQYEYGCIGIGGPNYRGWEDARTAVALARAADVAAAPAEFVTIEDCNGDGSDEVLICDGRQLLMASAYGGRLLYWFDMLTGQQLVGNQLPVIPLPYTGGEFPAVTSVPARWLPESASAQHSEELVEEVPPTRMGRYLPEWIWEGEPGPLSLAVRQMTGDRREWPLMAQTRVFADYVTVDDGETEEPPRDWLDSRLDKGGVTFIRYLTDELTLEKRLRIVYGRVTAAYALRNHDAQPHAVRLRVTSELCPDYAAVIRGGRDSLRFLDGDAPGVVNAHTGTAITIHSTRAWQGLEQRVDLCALTVGLVYETTLAPRSQQTFELRLGRGQSGGAPTPPTTSP